MWPLQTGAVATFLIHTPCLFILCHQKRSHFIQRFFFFFLVRDSLNAAIEQLDAAMEDANHQVSHASLLCISLKDCLLSYGATG